MQKYRITYAADVRMWKQHEIEAANDEEAKNMAHDLVVNIDGDLRKLDGKWITDDDIAGDDCILIDRLDANGEIEEEVQESTPACDPIMDRQLLQDFVRQLARMDPPDEREEIAEIEGEIEAFSHMIRKAKEIVRGSPAPAPAETITGAERAMFDLLCENFDAWEDEEDSVKEEHEDLIEKTEAFIDANRARFTVDASKPAVLDTSVKLALRNCIGALDSCLHQIEQMRGMFGDEDGTIQDAVDDAEEAQENARKVLG